MKESIKREFQRMEDEIGGYHEEITSLLDDFQSDTSEQLTILEHRVTVLQDNVNDVRRLLENAAAERKNGRLCRVHQRINHIYVSKPTNHDRSKYAWISHCYTPSVKDVYDLAQQAKGVFEPSWDRTPSNQKSDAQQRAANTILSLANFYDAIPFCHDENPTDTTGAGVRTETVDDYMETLLAAWGMDWQKISDLCKQHYQVRQPQTRSKRVGDASGSRDAKRIRRHG
ncbi:MAG: hypothetical protein Q9222_001903 [Ikaeria aurantiellina]